MLTREEIAEAREAQERATAGKWELGGPCMFGQSVVFAGDGHTATGLEGNDGTNYAGRNSNNAEYLVLAANMLPRALDNIVELRAQNAELLAMADDLRRDAEKWRKVRGEWRQIQKDEYASGKVWRLMIDPWAIDNGEEGLQWLIS